jgi:hypothetical protein
VLCLERVHLEQHLWVTTVPPLRGQLRAVKYEIRIEDGLDEGWSAWFDGMQITNEPGGVTVITGVVADQAALHGLLAKVRDLGLSLFSVQRIDPAPDRRSTP